MIRNRVKYIVLLIMILLTCIFYYNIPMIIMTGIYVSLPFLSRYFLHVWIEEIKIYVDTDKIMYKKNEDIKASIIAKNNSILSILNMNLKIMINNNFHEDYEEFYISMPAKSIRSSKNEIGQILNYDFTSKYAGNISITIKEIEIKDLLCMFENKMETDIKRTVMIIPDIVDVKLNLDTKENEEQSNEEAFAIGEDNTEIMGIRQFAPGDRLQRINWKASARYDEMMVKEYALIYDNELALLVELDSSTKEGLDNILDKAYSSMYSLYNDDNVFRVCWLNKNTAVIESVRIENEEDIIKALRQIYQTKPYEEHHRAYVTYEGEKSLKKSVYISCDDDGKAVTVCN